MIHLAADSIQCRKISADTIPIRFAYLIACFVRGNDDDGGHRWTELTPRHCHDRCREERKRERAKRRIAGRYRETPQRAGGRPRRALLLAHHCRTDGRVIVSYEPWRLCGRMYGYGWWRLVSAGRPVWSAAGMRDSVDRLRPPLDTQPLHLRGIRYQSAADKMTRTVGGQRAYC